MKEEFVTYEQALALKECGFDWECNHYYFHSANGAIYLKANIYGDYKNINSVGKSYCSAPTLALAQKWLRDEKGIHISVNPYKSFDVDADGELYNEYSLWSFELVGVVNADFMNEAGGKYESYESALSAGIDAALELIKQK